MAKHNESNMARRLRLLRRLGVAILVVVVGTLAGLYIASRHEPAFFGRAKQTAPAVLQRGSEEMLQHAASMQNATVRPGNWQWVVTADQINGWLAVDRAKNHSNLLPPGFSDPCVAISAKGITIGCRFRQYGINSVLSLEVEPYLTEPNVLALRIKRARAGAVPLPLGSVLDRISRAARDMQWRLEWRRAEGDRVALISIPTPSDAKTAVELKGLELADGEIRIRLTTKRR